MPDVWKRASKVPLHQNGDRHCVSNYRPISLTSVISKVLERIVRSQLLDYLLKNNIIPKNQYDFVPKKSTVTNLLVCLNDWTCNFDSNISTDVIYLYYSICFDGVCRDKLLYKLSRCGITGSAWNWIIKAF